MRVVHDRTNHLNDRGARRVVGGSFLEQRHDLGTAVARALEQPVQGRLVDEPWKGLSVHLRVPREGHHRLAVGPEGDRLDRGR